MEKVLIALVLVVIIMAILAGAILDNSEKSTTNAVTQENAPQRSAFASTEETARPEAIPEQKAPTEDAKQVLTKISEAKVKENTEELRDVFGQLNDICKKAVETRDAMLLAKYDTNEPKTLNSKGGTDNGNK